MTVADVFLSNADRLLMIRSMYADYRKKFSAVSDVTAREALELAAGGRALFIDVRTKAERAVSMIPEAATWHEYMAESFPLPDKKIILYCTIGYRSGLAAKELTARGVSVFNLACGILGWIHAGGRMVDAGGPVERAHVYGQQWDLLPTCYETIFFSLFERMQLRLQPEDTLRPCHKKKE
jgi:rhodanese-related sulfurtransferase